MAITCGISTAAADYDGKLRSKRSLRYRKCNSGAQHVWTPFEGEKLVLEREHHNSYDCYATTVMKDDVIVGRVPRVSKFPPSP